MGRILNKIVKHVVIILAMMLTIFSISFAFEDNNDLVYNDIRMLGDIFICIPQMKRQAIEYGHSEKRELAFLAVHGILHLLGYDHMNEEDEKVMFALQELILDGQNIKR